MGPLNRDLRKIWLMLLLTSFKKAALLLIIIWSVDTNTFWYYFPIIYKFWLSINPLFYLLQYHGGTNFGRTAGGPFITTSYDYDAPIDEYGILSGIKM